MGSRRHQRATPSKTHGFLKHKARFSVQQTCQHQHNSPALSTSIFNIFHPHKGQLFNKPKGSTTKRVEQSIFFFPGPSGLLQAQAVTFGSPNASQGLLNFQCTPASEMLKTGARSPGSTTARDGVKSDAKADERHARVTEQASSGTAATDNGHG